MTSMFFDQSMFDVRCEWGLNAIRLVSNPNCVTIIVDVLSFSTCVDVATTRGATIFPCRWKDHRAKEFADEVGAELAERRGCPGRYSLSPASLMAIPESTKLVLPSPNGSELTIEASQPGAIIVAGCFRNATAVARYALTFGKPIAVIPCGERWPDGTLRPAAEDIAAAGAIISELPGTQSAESQAAVGAWTIAKQDLNRFLSTSASGRELIDQGFHADVEIAGQWNVSTNVPILLRNAYVRAGGRSDL